MVRSANIKLLVSLLHLLYNNEL